MLLANSLSVWKEGLIQETLAISQKDITCVAKAVAFCLCIEQKEREFDECRRKIKNQYNVVHIDPCRGFCSHGLHYVFLLTYF